MSPPLMSPETASSTTSSCMGLSTSSKRIVKQEKKNSRIRKKYNES
jgi:hypothetical protein